MVGSCDADVDDDTDGFVVDGIGIAMCVKQ